MNIRNGINFHFPKMIQRTSNVRVNYFKLNFKLFSHHIIGIIFIKNIEILEKKKKTQPINSKEVKKINQ